MEKEKFVKICPKCGSTDITNVKANLGTSMTSSYADFMKDKCNDCEFIGSMPEVTLKEIKEFRKKLKKT